MSANRTVIANITVSIDGYVAEPGGGMGWLIEHVVHEQMSTNFAGIWRGADTALLGRTNYEGFHGYWPPVAENPAAGARDRDMARWLNEVQKVVFSRTLTSVEWKNARIAQRSPADEVRALKAEPGRDIIVLSSVSIIRELLAADLVDQLQLYLLPAILGDGLALFDGGQPPSTWQLGGTAVLPTGAIGLTYRRG